MSKMGKSISQKNDEINQFAMQDNWELVIDRLNKTESEWKNYRTWAALTISTEDIEQLEISLAQAKTFANLKQKSNFFGEFIMFSKLVEHIPHREGLHIEEIL
jgi:hypothetical protein